MTFEFDSRPSIRSAWSQTRLLVRGKLTDRKIEKYMAEGWYSQEVKDMRRERQARRNAKKMKRDGSFLIAADGRKIYSPI